MNLTPITSVFNEMIEWITSAMSAVLDIFYTSGSSGGAGSLTFLGMLAVAGLAVSVFFLILGVISNFLHFRG